MKYLVLFLLIILLLMILGYGICKLFRMEHMQTGGANLRFNNISSNKFNFDLNKITAINDVTAIAFKNSNMYVTSQSGKVYMIQNYKNNNNEEEIYDASKLNNFTDEGMEEGLLGIAFNQSKIYLSYTTVGDDTNLLVDEFDFNNNKLSNRRNIITVAFENDYHHAGTIIFDKNNNMYLSTGDGGPQGADPNNKAQDKNSLRGKIIKINPRTKETKIIALGLRNPWKISLDNQNRIWIGDAGWNSVESVKLMENLNEMYNFGWNYFEGSKRIRSGKNFDDFNPPAYEYPKPKGGVIIGGYFLNNQNIYVFADYTGILKAIEYDGDKWIRVADQKINEKIYTFGYDGQQLFLGTNKNIYRININKS